MGLELVDLVFRCEREFKIRLDRNELGSLLNAGNASDPPTGKCSDIQVRDFVSLVEATVKVQNPSYDRDVFEGVKRAVVDCLDVDESEVTPNAWMRRDLGVD